MSAHTDFGPTYNYEQISNYYLELERLLDRLERSTTHYQVLGLGRSATGKQVRVAYQEALILLRPTDAIKAAMPRDTLRRVERAFERLSRSFNLLDNFGKRVEYDNSLLPKISAPLLVELPPALIAPAARVEIVTPDAELHEIMGLMFGSTCDDDFCDSPISNPTENRRRSNRYNLLVPARVTGVDRVDGMWYELAETFDVSDLGVGLRMRRSVRNGAVVHVSLPLPVKLRSHGHNDQSYNVYALVRRVEQPKNGFRKVGLEFLGEEAPLGYSDSPWATFRTGEWEGLERRRETRVDRAEVVGVEYLNEQMKHIRQEVALTENISPSGARVYLKAAPPEFNLVKVTNLNRSFETLATVRNRFVGADGFERLCLRFVDKKWPV